ncbi:MAG: SufD family Fe-S cluster assembly protein [Eggerthellaceae bacterium]|nr:SufD family Fe-S cluster assembly protein [Eggerthellaceae bacterium]
MIVNRMPAITWHKFKGNDAEIELPALSAPEVAAISFSVPPALQFTETTVNEGTSLEAGTAPVTGAFDEALAAASAIDEWETGMGKDGQAWLQTASTRKLSVVVPAGHKEEKPLVVRVEAQDGAAAVAAVDVVLQAGAALKLAVHVDSPVSGNGLAGCALRLVVGDGAQLDLSSIQTLDNSWIHLDDTGVFLGEGARFTSSQTVLGAAESYTGFAADLSGREAEAVVDTRYLGHDANKIDFNYVIRQRGVQTNCTLTANGVLMDSSAKVLRGTIDLIHGAKGAIGQENETVLLVNEDVRNKTIPIILCDEDDVQGAHGATIGHVNPEQLGYMQTRGLTPEQTEDLFAVAAFDYAQVNAFDAQVRHAVERLGVATLGSTYELLAEED